jgi:hypothetical protein
MHNGLAMQLLTILCLNCAPMSEDILQGVPKKTKTIEINVLLEFECLSTLLNPHVHQSLT